MGINVGIDLGTTFSAVARINPVSGKPEIIKNGFGSPITPSVLCFEKDGNVLYGEDAKSMMGAGDPNSIAFFKRNMGNDLFSVEFWGKTYNATDLSAILLKNLKEEAERQSGERIDGVVITVPAYFSHKERSATLEAGNRAGLNVLTIINEPTAAALAYGLTENSNNQTVLIYDLGGGTFDVTVAKINNQEIDVLGSDGNPELGGKDWDDCIARYLTDRFQEEYGIDLSSDDEAVSSLLVTAENVKKQLTSRDEVVVPLAYKNIHGSIKITEEIFESISQFLLGETKDIIDRLFSFVSISWSDITGVILVGGSTRMRMIHKYVKEMSGMEPLRGVNVDEAVALGAAIRANITNSGKPIGLLKSAQSSSNVLLIKGAKAISDVTAHSLGMIAESSDGERYINSIIIKKNTRIPANDTKSYKLKTHPGKNEMEIYVLQGEFPKPLDNVIINKYLVTGIEHVPMSDAFVDVTYGYTENGVIEVSAFQKNPNRKLHIKIESIPSDMSWVEKSPKEISASALPSIDVFLCLDVSGSMDGLPLGKAVDAIYSFIDKMNPDITSIGLIPFASSTDCEEMLTNDYEHFKYNLFAFVADEADEYGNTINSPRRKYGGGTSANPLEVAYSLLKKRESEIKYIIVLTDGQWAHPEQAIKSAKKCHDEKIEIMALGFGEADYDFLCKIASTNEFAEITALSNIGNAFSKIAQAINDGRTGLRV